MVVEFAFEPMSANHVREISAWRYEPPYDIYNIVGGSDGAAEPLDSSQRRDYLSALSGGELVGFFCFGAEGRVPGGNYDEDALDIGLGLRPDLTGKGIGLKFVLAGMEYSRGRFSPERFRLTVATFNERAIRVYERAGFSREETFTRSGGDQEFLIMKREA